MAESIHYLTAAQLAGKLSVGLPELRNMPVLVVDKDGERMAVISVGVMEGHALLTVASYEGWDEPHHG
jgi:hypothetical protein